MKPASSPRADKDQDRLMVVDAGRRSIDDARVGELSSWLSPGDLLVVNDAATLPAAIGFARGGRRAELRLLRTAREGVAEVVVLGDGDASMRTEDRGPPPQLREGERLELDGGGVAIVLAVDPDGPRRARIHLEGDACEALVRLYRAARPVQYAYLEGRLALWDVQTVFAGRPWASEMPSAGRPLSWRLLGRLRERGVSIARITHGAGLSSTGDAALDRKLPLPERYAIDRAAVAEVSRARDAGRRVIAAGTSVVRALESAVRHGADGVLEAHEATTELVIGKATPMHVVDAVLTGMHEVDTSHFALLEAFAARDLLERAVEHGTRVGYLLHEFGDSMLVFGRRGRPGVTRPGRWATIAA
jgi:S-adenosylmethionine:tRNA ribosyltransferase-isomerase